MDGAWHQDAAARGELGSHGDPKDFGKAT